MKFIQWLRSLGPRKKTVAPAQRLPMINTSWDEVGQRMINKARAEALADRMRRESLADQEATKVVKRPPVAESERKRRLEQTKRREDFRWTQKTDSSAPGLPDGYVPPHMSPAPAPYRSGGGGDFGGGGAGSSWRRQQLLVLVASSDSSSSSSDGGSSCSSGGD